jgi:phospholipid/cholesterol/gamma-HCH transport system permease protein
MPFFSTLGSFAIYQIRFIREILGKQFWNEILSSAGRFIRMVTIPVLGTCIPFSMIIAFHGWTAAELFGAQRFLPGAISLMVLREIGPVVAGLIITAVLGNAIASEIALMRLRGEFTYLELIGVSPFKFVIIPRVIALIITSAMIFIITVIFSIVGIYFYSVYLKGLAEGTFRDNIWNVINFLDLFGGLLKSATFGLIIGQISTFLGLEAEESAEGVGKASSSTVVIASISFIIANVVLSLVVFGEFTPELR